MLAGLSFLLLAVYGWGLRWETLVDYFLVILALFAVLICIAVLLAWCVRKWSQSRNADKKEKGRQ